MLHVGIAAAVDSRSDTRVLEPARSTSSPDTLKTSATPPAKRCRAHPSPRCCVAAAIDSTGRRSPRRRVAGPVATRCPRIRANSAKRCPRRRNPYSPNSATNATTIWPGTAHSRSRRASSTTRYDATGNAAPAADPGRRRLAVPIDPARPTIDDAPPRRSRRNPLLQNSREFGKTPSAKSKSIQSEFGDECDHNLARHT
jgi:hypothetical protein